MMKIAYEEAVRVREEYRARTGKEVELYVSTSGFSYFEIDALDLQMVLDALNKENVKNHDIFIHGYSGVDVIRGVLGAFAVAKKDNPSLQLWQGEYYAHQKTEDAWKVYNTLKNCADFMAAGADMYINLGVPAENAFITPSAYSPTAVFHTMAVLQQNIRKANDYEGAYSFEGDATSLPLRHYFSRTDGSYLSILGAENGGQVLLGNPGVVISAIDAYGTAVPLNGNSLDRQNTLFIISSEPLLIHSAQ